ncbi:hypothetical protein RRG08_016564 [Elysia crispata]|uniref:Uncharacterized protein n=1 Tax=Elysia crispata TaxID=231223 RepID=A0AAE1ATJ6_9GAST|nr:hypothetical protein RRG08_016564 [Elysia crispata]
MYKAGFVLLLNQDIAEMLSTRTSKEYCSSSSPSGEHVLDEKTWREGQGEGKLRISLTIGVVFRRLLSPSFKRKFWQNKLNTVFVTPIIIRCDNPAADCLATLTNYSMLDRLVYSQLLGNPAVSPRAQGERDGKTWREEQGDGGELDKWNDRNEGGMQIFPRQNQCPFRTPT